ncbi:MAG: hypothetical protein GJT30_15970 [Geobacter sp.]|nr:hypothetical protein [Geobacter sp.]
MRYINTGRIVAAQLTTPAENPLVTDDSRMIDAWFDSGAIRKQLFKRVSRAEQEAFAADLLGRGFLQSGNLFLDPRAVLFAEMENQLLGGIVTIGFQENGKPVELKVGGKVFDDLCVRLKG